MSKIWNSLQYGSTKTKIFLWAVILLSIVSLGMLCFGVVLSQLPIMAAGFIMGMVTLIVSQSVSLETLETKGKNKKKTDAAKKKGRDELEKPSSKTKDAGEKNQEGQEDADVFKDMDDKVVKMLMKQYKVTKDHKLVMVDKCDVVRKRQCPAFVWVNKGLFHVLMIGKEPKEVAYEITQLKEIRYEKNVTAHPAKDYQAVLQSPFICKLFGEYLPTYNDKQVGNKLVYSKNLYVVKDDIRFTNTSARNLLELLKLPFVVDDTVTRSQRYHEYFKKLYRISILCRDKVYTMEEYKMQAELLLVKMSQDDTLPYAVMRQTLGDMLRLHLISRDMLSLIEQSGKTEKKNP